MAAESPAMQQTAGALQAQASATAAAARNKAAAGLRQGAARVIGRRPTSGNGSGGQSAGPDQDSFVPMNGKMGEHGPVD
jgi:hypothetical protein